MNVLEGLILWCLIFLFLGPAALIGGFVAMYSFELMQWLGFSKIAATSFAMYNFLWATPLSGLVIIAAILIWIDDDLYKT